MTDVEHFLRLREIRDLFLPRRNALVNATFAISREVLTKIEEVFPECGSSSGFLAGSLEWNIALFGLTATIHLTESGVWSLSVYIEGEASTLPPGLEMSPKGESGRSWERVCEGGLLEALDCLSLLSRSIYR